MLVVDCNRVGESVVGVWWVGGEPVGESVANGSVLDLSVSQWVGGRPVGGLVVGGLSVVGVFNTPSLK